MGERNSATNGAAELSDRFWHINRVVNRAEWRSTQHDLLVALRRCKHLWNYPVDYESGDMYFREEDIENMRAISG